MQFAPNEDSNQSSHPCSLIKVPVVRVKKLYIFGYPKCAQWIFRSDCANAQADLNLRWSYMSDGTLSDITVQITYFILYRSINGEKSAVVFIPSWTFKSYVLNHGNNTNKLYHCNTTCTESLTLKDCCYQGLNPNSADFFSGLLMGHTYLSSLFFVLQRFYSDSCRCPLYSFKGFSWKNKLPYLRNCRDYMTTTS